jgi:hypothetical protein
MDVPRLQPKQRFAKATWIAAGLAAILLGLPPYYDRRGEGGGGVFVYPDPRGALFFFGVLLAVSGITALFIKGRPLILMGLGLLGMAVGGGMGFAMFQVKHADVGWYGKGDEDLRSQRGMLGFRGAILGAGSVPIAAAAIAMIRRRSDRRPSRTV